MVNKTRTLPIPPYLGAAYYPEDWPLEQIDDDIRLMLDAGMNVMRIGEFAWGRMEPQEGRYDFDWLHLVVGKLAAAGIATILGTPTATPPIWLVEQYPEVLAVGDMAGGIQAQHGARRHVCPNNPVYREHCARIVTRMAEEFGANPDVIGWQVDNEVYPYRGRGCRCPVCVGEFHGWLGQRYGTVEALNAAWGLNIFSQAYQSFAQVPFPRGDTWHHPSLLTAWMEFQADSYIAFIHAQSGVLHALATQPVGTDMMPTNGISHYDMTRQLDVAQYNHYNSMQNLWESAFWMDFQRPLKERPFWNTETSTCWNGSTAANGYREPGFCRANSWIPIALGGEANLFWLWRAHWSGQEVMHGSVVSSAGRPLHIIGEVREISAGFRAAAAFLNGTRPTPSGIAMHFSELAWWQYEFQPMVNGFNYSRRLLESYYHPLQQAQLRADVIDPAAPLDAYRVVCSPFLPALDESGLRERLRAWIEAGGTWIAGPLTDVRTLDATKYTSAPFGCLEDWAGVYCPFEIPADPRQFRIQWSDGRAAEGSVWYSAFELRGAEALATYQEGPMQGMAAVTRIPMGKGQVVALGTLPQPDDLQRLLLNLGESAGVRPAAIASSNLLVAPRAGAAGRGLVAVELEHQHASLTIDHPMTDLLTGQRREGRIDLPPYAVLVLKD